MSVFGGPYKDLEEWEDISRIVSALQAGELMPVTRTLIAEWRELALALAALSPLSPGGGIGGFVVSPSGDMVVDSSGNPISLTQGIGADRVLTDGDTIIFDFSTPGEIKGVRI